MNVIDLLKDDHIRLRTELVKLHKNLNHPDIRGRIKHFISEYEVLESVEEDILFPLLKGLPMIPEVLEKCHEDHNNIWNLLNQLLESADAMRFEEFQRVFFHLAAVVEGHIDMEERVVFSMIERYVNEETLEKMGDITGHRLFAFRAFEHSICV